MSWNSTPLISSLTWTAAGQPASWTWPFASMGGTSINASRSYDTAGRVTATELSGYGYDAAGRLTTLSQSLYAPSDSNPANSGITLGTTNWAVGYDATGRITSFNDSTTSATSGFTYDANGNRLTSSQSPGPAAGIASRSRTYSITTNTNRLASYSQTDVVSGSPVNTTTTFSINANGDTTGDGTRTYGFDVESRLASTSTGTSPTVSTSRYSHNALGQRTFKTLPVTTSPSTADPGYAFAYDEDGTLIGEYGATGTPSAGTTEYIWLPSPKGPIPVVAVINGTIFAVQADHLNTPRRLSNTSAQAVWQWKYSAFGDEQPTLAANRFVDLAMNPNPGTTTIPPVTFNLRYPGQYADVESGLNYNYFRSYSSDTGGYTQADPIGLDGEWNRFGYVKANPLRFSDFLGLQAADANSYPEKDNMYPGSRCTIEQHISLQGAVLLNCSTPRTCNQNQSCPQLQENLSKARACYDARRTINNVCYNGGDITHRVEQDKALANINTCLGWLNKKQCYINCE